MPDFDDYAFLLFGSTTPSYVFVDDLNRLYGLQLNRAADMELQQSLWPMFTYRDTLTRLNYYLIERPTSSAATASHWAPGHKMMILKGERATDIAKFICEDFSTPPPLPDHNNPTVTEHPEILSSYQQSFTPVNLYDTNAPAPSSKKVLKERTELENLFTAILDILDLSGIE
jgi:hypothetical protein